MDVAERPVVVPLRAERLERRRRVRLMALAAVDRRVEEPDVERARDAAEVGALTRGFWNAK